jgi:hypothetical protein
MNWIIIWIGIWVPFPRMWTNVLDWWVSANYLISENDEFIITEDWQKIILE